MDCVTYSVLVVAETFFWSLVSVVLALSLVRKALLVDVAGTSWVPVNRRDNNMFFIYSTHDHFLSSC